MRVRIAMAVGVLIAFLAALPARAEEPEDIVWCLTHWSHC